jgi:hypothetical protein
MKRRLLLSALTIVSLGGALFTACDGTQPKSGCLIQTTPRGGPGFAVKYAVTTSTGDCSFLGTAKDSDGHTVAVETVGVSLYGDVGSLRVGLRPAYLTGAGDLGAAVGSFNNDNTQCTALKLDPATGVISDPNFASTDPAAVAPDVRLTYTFSNLKFIQAENVFGTQLGADLQLDMVPVDATAGGTECHATIKADGVWYSSTYVLPDAGTDNSGNHCDTDASCASAEFSLPDPANFVCVPVLASVGQDVNVAGTENVPGARCVPKTHVPVGAK